MCLEKIKLHTDLVKITPDPKLGSCGLWKVHFRNQKYMIMEQKFSKESVPSKNGNKYFARLALPWQLECWKGE